MAFSASVRSDPRAAHVDWLAAPRKPGRGKSPENDPHEGTPALLVVRLPSKPDARTAARPQAGEKDGVLWPLKRDKDTSDFYSRPVGSPRGAIVSLARITSATSAREG